MSDYIQQLNDVQREAVVNYKGAALIIAGAGSGKTRVLTCRIAYMLSQGVAPSGVLALTFTNKAAREMKERIATIVDYRTVRQMSMGTFHSVFSHILRAEAHHLGFPNTFTIYETSDSRNLVKTIVKEMNLDGEKYKPKEIFARISLMKNTLVTPALYANQSTLISDDVKAGRTEFATIYRTYMARCKKNGAMDFDDLLLYTNILFKSKPEVLAVYQEKFKYVLVDEYQDTNYSQYLIIKLIAALSQNICVVGDDAQSIYSFRGAKIDNILRFQDDYPKAQVFKLEQNYRSTQNIVGAANSVIAKNTKQLKKNVYSKNEEGELISLIRAEGDRDEALMVCRDLEKLHRAGTPYSGIAILYRANSQCKSFEDQLRVRQIPYRIYGGQSFYQRAEIKSIIAYLRLLINVHDDEAFKRVINFPQRGIGLTTVSRIEAAAREADTSLWNIITTSDAATIGVSNPTMKRLAAFVDMINEFKAKVNDVDVYELTNELVYKTGIVALFRDNPAPEAQSSFENVEELINSLKIQVEETAKEEDIKLLVGSWIQDITLMTDMDEAEDGAEAKSEVTLMTIHAAKGLEFDAVYIVGVEESNFPSQRSLDDPNGLEEERRLFYVAVTRAIKRLTISFATSRYKWGSVTPSRASRFVKEIDVQYIENIDLLELVKPKVKEAKPASSSYGAGRYQRGGGSGSRDAEGGSYGYGNRYSRREDTPAPPKLKPIASATVSMPDGDTPIALASDIAVGDRVSHARFGFGEVMALEPFNGDHKVTVNFDLHASKTLLMNFAKLSKVDKETENEE